jgi:hypothetical protein
MGKKFFITAMVLILPIFLSACMSPKQKISEKAAENIAEKALEKSTGGKANVDINQGNVSVDTKEGSMKTGENVSLPADFPSDVYVYEGSIKSVITNNEQNGFNVTIETDKPIAEVKAAYMDKIVSGGWEKTGTMDVGDTISIGAKKDNRSLSVMISSSDGKTMIILGVYEQK